MTLPRSFEDLNASLRALAGSGPANLLGLLLVVAVVAPFVAFGVPGVVGAEASYVVLSGSMEPELSPGDVIFVYAVDPRNIEVGDVITYATGGSDVPTTHRVTEVIYTDDVPSGVLFHTKGDANEDPDVAPRPGGDVIGRVPAVSLPMVGEVFVAVPFMGYVIRFVNTGTGFVLLVALPIILFVANEGWRIATTSDGDRQTDARVDGGASSTAAVGSVGAAGAGATYVAPGEVGGETASGEFASGAGPVVDRPGLDLTLTAVVLVAITAYTAAVAMGAMTVWSVAAVVASFGGLLLAVGARFLPIPSRDTDEDGTEPHDGDHGDDDAIEDTASAPGYVVIGGDADTGFAVGVLDLTVAAGVLGLATLYAARVALADTTGVSVGAAVATFGGFVFVVGLRRMTLQPVPEPADSTVVGDLDRTTTGETLAGSTDGIRPEWATDSRVVRAAIPAAFEDRPTIEIGSRAELLRYASVLNHLVLEDAETGTYYLPDGDLVYRAHPSSGTDGSPPAVRPAAVGDPARNGPGGSRSDIAAEADATEAQENS